MKKVFALLFVCLSFTFYAQNKVEDSAFSIQKGKVLEAIKLSAKSNSLSQVDELLNSNTITEGVLLARLYSHKANFLQKAAVTKPKVSPSQGEVDEIVKNYDIAIEKSNCEGKWRYEIGKIRGIEDLNCHNNCNGNSNNDLELLYEANLKELKLRGYKEEEEGIGIGVHSFVGMENWIGADFSFSSYLQSNYKFETRCANRKYYYSMLLSGDAFKFSYSHSLKSNTNDISFSLIDLNAPVVFIPARFGYQFGSDLPKSCFYYRPGIGFSIWLVSLSYSYNFVFTNEFRSAYEKHLFSISFNYPITNRNNKK